MRVSALLSRRSCLPLLFRPSQHTSHKIITLRLGGQFQHIRACQPSAPTRHRRSSLPLTTAHSMASPLPQFMADDLALLQQHYNALPFTHAHSPLQPAAAPVASDIPPSSPAALPAAAAPVALAQQLLTSSPAAAAATAADSRPKRRRTSGKQSGAPQATTAAASTGHSLLGTPGAHSLDLGPASLGTAATNSAQTAEATEADAVLQIVTPPPKSRSRRSRAATAAAVAQQQDGPTHMDLAVSTTTTTITATTSTAAAAAGVVDVAAATTPVALPRRTNRRRSASAAPVAAADASIQQQQQQQQPAVDLALVAAALGLPLLPDAPAAAQSTATAAAAPAGASRATRSRKRKVTVVQVQEEEQLEADTAAAAAAADAAMADAAALDTAAAAAAPARGRRKSTSSRGRGRGRATSRSRRSTTKDPTAATAAAADGSADGSSDPDYAAAVDVTPKAKPVKPVRRTKKVIAAEVLEAASQGHFDELTDLSSTYSHVALFNNNSNAAAWAQLMQLATQQQATAPAAAAAPSALAPPPAAAALAGAAAAADPTDEQQQGQQQEQQQQQVTGSNGRSSSLSLCKSSGLGSFRQQVWIHSQSQPSVFDAELVATQDTLLTATQPAAEAAADSNAAAADVAGAAEDFAGGGDGAATAAAGGKEAQVQLPPSQPLTAAVQQQQLKLLPNLGYACLCMTMRKYDIFNSRDMVKKTRDAPDGLQKCSELALQNARDLVPLIHWNEAHGIRLFRLSSNIFPWMTSYSFEDLPHWPDIQKALRAAGDLAKQLGHRLTFHPSEYCKIAGERPDWVTQSVAELEVHSRIFDEMGFLPATPYNKINIHVGGTYGDKDAALDRFSQVVNERLSPNCKARLTVENDDRASLYSVVDLMKVHNATGIPIVFDFHHWKFCTGDQTQEEAFRLALTTWPAGIRPVVHWSESPEDPKKMLKAHSEYIDGPVNLYGLEGDVDVMIESKGKELALLEYRQYIIDGIATEGPRTVRAAKFAAEAAAAAAAAAAAESSDTSDTSDSDSSSDETDSGSDD